MDAIVAVYDDWGIGCEGDQPIALSADRLSPPTTANFKRITSTGYHILLQTKLCL